MSQTLVQKLLESLEPIARVSGGYATVVDSRGKRIRTVDSSGREIADLRGVLYPEALDALRSGRPTVGVSQLQSGAEAWFLPLGDVVLAASNIERIHEEQRLFEEFSRALPMIAAVAGGEAVLFDENGIRKVGYRPDGQICAGVDEYSEQCRKAISERRPLIGPATLAEGAMAVRIPVGRTFGLSFNNEWSVKQKRKLIESTFEIQYARYIFDDIVGDSEAIRKCKKQASRIAGTGSTVLLLGESGTGKELFAHAIHNASLKRSRPFIAVNCSAIPSTLAESYLFGYEGGSFTGARKDGQEGVFEQAAGGTLFLDEISEMDLALQAKLLRVLQDKEVVRVGGRKRIPVDVRVIAASNKDLETLVAEGKFREDLYYRLNVIPIRIPPLRERAEDILPLAYHFLQRLNPVMGTNVTGFSTKAIDCMQAYSWPGNIRELQNCIERALSLVTEEKQIELSHLPLGILKALQGTNNPHNGNGKVGKVNPRTKMCDAVATAEMEAVHLALAQANGNRSLAAEFLGISTTTLWRKMRKLGLGDKARNKKEENEKELVRNALQKSNNIRREAARILGISNTTLWRKMKRYGMQC